MMRCCPLVPLTPCHFPLIIGGYLNTHIRLGRVHYMTKMSAIPIVMLIGLVLAPTAVFADSSSSTDWNLGVGGLYSYAGGNNPLVGTNIPIYSVTGDMTPSQNGVSLSIVNGLLDFTSGASTGTWSWGAGAPGTLKIYGCIPRVTANCDPSTNLLLDDDFQSVSIVQVIGALDVVFGNVTGTIEQSVANYYGLPTNTFATGSFSADDGQTEAVYGGVQGESCS